MSNFLENLKIDRWYKVFIYLGTFLFIISLFSTTHWLTNKQTGLLGLALFFIGLGEWKNEKVAVMFKPSNAYTGPAGFLQWPIRKMDLIGIIMLLVGIVFLIMFIISL